jgi:hypothetical protein
MEREKATKRIPRPNLHVPSAKWSAAQNGGLGARIAIIGTVSAIVIGIGLVFIYPYFNIDRFREYETSEQIESTVDSLSVS